MAAIITGGVLIISGLPGCGPGQPVKSIDIDGSSTVYLLTEAVAVEYRKAMPEGAQVTVSYSGTGGGFKKFCRGEIDICDASRPIRKEEMQAARESQIEYIELPVSFDAITVAVNTGNPLESITVAQLKKMWEPEANETITRWNQVTADWPDAELALYGAGTDSGTFDYFTEAIVGKAKSSRGDYGANEDDNVIVQGIAGNEHALGYLPFAYYIANKSKLKALAIDTEKGNSGPVLPSVETVKDGTYPLSRPLFIYVNRKAAERPEVKAFVEFYLKNAETLAGKVKYVPLNPSAYSLGLERFDKLQTGTGFAGESEIGLPVEEVMKREPKQ